MKVRLNKVPKLKRVLNVFVTAEYPDLGRSGGIGAAIKELMMGLHGLNINEELLLLYVSHDQVDSIQRQKVSKTLEQVGARAVFAASADVTWDRSVKALSFTAFRSISSLISDLSERDEVVLHFHDYLGIGFYSLHARGCGLIPSSVQMVIHAHGPTAWALEQNQTCVHGQETFTQIHLEKECYRLADAVISPSRYMLEWLNAQNVLDSTKPQFLLPNLISRQAVSPEEVIESEARWKPKDGIERVIFLGRHEYRKGWRTVLRTIDELNQNPPARPIEILLVGQFAVNDGVSSASELLEHARMWELPWGLETTLTSEGVRRLLSANPDALVIVASPVENCPYVVLEAAANEAYLVSSSIGGSPEILHVDTKFVEPSSTNLRHAINEFLEGRWSRSKPRHSRLQQLEILAKVFEEIRAMRNVSGTSDYGSVSIQISVVVTHFKRPDALFRALSGFARQSDSEFELIVVDDYSELDVSDVWWARCCRLIDAMGWKLVMRNSNGYLGAARNSGAEVCSGEYLLFFDDDDVPSVELISAIKKSLAKSAANLIVPLAVESTDSLRAWVSETRFGDRISYLPTLGPHSASAHSNVFGMSVMAISRELFDRVGGYSEIAGAGFEDWEFYVKACRVSSDSWILPVALFVYSTGHFSMTSTMSLFRSISRVSLAMSTSADPKEIYEIITEQLSSSLLESVANRRAWKLRTMGRSEDEVSLVFETDPEKILDLLIRASTNLGNDSFRNALSWTKGNAPNLNLGLRRPVSTHGPETLKRGTDCVDSETACEISIALTEGDHDRLSEVLSTAEELRLQMSADTAKQLASLTWSRAVALRSVRELLERLIASQETSSPEQLAALATLCFRAGIVEQGLDLFNEVFRGESADYLSSSPDVQAPLRTAFEPWEHFVRFGKSEGRAGFGLTRSILEAVKFEPSNQVLHKYLLENGYARLGKKVLRKVGVGKQIDEKI